MSQPVPIPPLPGRQPKPPPPRNSRDRFGCRHCKTKKKKCDKVKPTCSRCNERGWECVYDPVPSKKTHRPRSVPGGSSSLDLVEHVSQFSLGPSTDPDRITTSDATSSASSPASMTFDIAPDPGPYLKHFTEHLAPLLSFSDASNPFVEHILPLAERDTVLRSAFCMVAAAHQTQMSKGDEPELYSTVIQGHRNAIKDRTSYQDYNLAVNILFCYFEMIQNSTLSASNLEIHLHGATNIILPGITTKAVATRWLQKSLYFFDVLRSLTYGSKPFTTDQYLHRPTKTPKSPMAYAEVDPIFGIATDLWPLLRRVALVTNLKQQVDSSSALTQPTGHEDTGQATQTLIEMHRELEDKKMEVWSSLQGWETPEVAVHTEQPHYSTQLQGMVAHAEAYKSAGLLHLLREVYKVPDTSAQVQTRAMSVIEACSRVLELEGPTTGLVWPLFVASLDILDPAGVSESQAAFSKLYNKRQANNVLVAWRICQEIWNRRSMGIRDVYWKRVATDLDVTIVFG